MNGPPPTYPPNSAGPNSPQEGAPPPHYMYPGMPPYGMPPPSYGQHPGASEGGYGWGMPPPGSAGGSSANGREYPSQDGRKSGDVKTGDQGHAEEGGMKK